MSVMAQGCLIWGFIFSQRKGVDMKTYITEVPDHIFHSNIMRSFGDNQ